MSEDNSEDIKSKTYEIMINLGLSKDDLDYVVDDIMGLIFPTPIPFSYNGRMNKDEDK